MSVASRLQTVVGSNVSDVVANDPRQIAAKNLSIAVALLLGFGLVAIYAASSLKGAQQFGDAFFFFRKQAITTFLGFVVIVSLQKIPWTWIEKATLPVLLTVLFLLSLIFVPGLYTKVGGAERWLRIGGVGGQPAELTKLALVLFLAKNLSRPRLRIDSLRGGVLPNIIVLGVLSGFLILQRDLGTPVVLGVITMLMLFTAGVASSFLVVCWLGAVSAVGLAIVMEPYRMARIMSFLDPWGTLQEGGFQIIQSFVAFQNGGIFGVGLGESKQKLFFLPEAHTDFILSVIGEELGLLGVVFVCVAFFYVGLCGYRIARHQTSAHKTFLAFGLTSAIILQAILNMGVTMGLLPTKGMPLPFISSGSSSLLVCMVMAGLLIRLGRSSEADKTSAASGSP